jgi:hypothetical protein
MANVASDRCEGEISCEIVEKYVSPELACIVEMERGRAKFGASEDVTSYALRATILFRREDGTWKVAHRHADPASTVQQAASYEIEIISAWSPAHDRPPSCWTGLYADFLERRKAEVQLRRTRPPRRSSNKPLPHARREGALRREGEQFSLQTEPLFAPVSLEGYRSIRIAAEALRTQPRRCERRLGMCSPPILKLVRCPYPHCSSYGPYPGRRERSVRADILQGFRLVTLGRRWCCRVRVVTQGTRNEGRGAGGTSVHAQQLYLLAVCPDLDDQRVGRIVDTKSRNADRINSRSGAYSGTRCRLKISGLVDAFHARSLA